MEISLESTEFMPSLQGEDFDADQGKISDKKLTGEAGNEKLSEKMDSLLGNDQATAWHKFLNVLIEKHKAGGDASIVSLKKQNGICSHQYHLQKSLPVDERKKVFVHKSGNSSESNTALKNELLMSSPPKSLKNSVQKSSISLDKMPLVSKKRSGVMTLTEKNKTETKKVVDIRDPDKGIATMSESINPIKAKAQSVKKIRVAADLSQSSGPLTAQTEVSAYAEGTRTEMTTLPGQLKKVQAAIQQSENVSSLKQGETRLTYNFKRWDAMGRQSVELTIQDPQSASQSIVATTSTKELRDKLDLARHLQNAPDLTLRDYHDQRGGRGQAYRTFDSEDDA